MRMNTTFNSSTQLSAEIAATLFDKGGLCRIHVVTPGPGGGTTQELTFTMDNPEPFVLGLDPTSKKAGDAAFNMTVGGYGFNTESKVWANGIQKATTYVSPNLVNASIPASEITTTGSLECKCL